jgi:hypothetical protein
MRLRQRHTALYLILTVLACACDNAGRGPTSPTSASDPGTFSSAIVPPATVEWECVRHTASTTTTVGGWSFAPPPPTCPSTRAGLLGVGVGLVTVAPGNLRAAVSAGTVRLDWDLVSEPFVSHLIEAGSGPGLSNLASLNTGSMANTLTVAAVPAGTYHVRVRAIGPDNRPGPPSNEITVTVSGCTAAPGAPSNLNAQVSGNQVVLTWTGTGSDPASIHSIEVGSGPGLVDVIVFDTGSAAQRLSATAPNGTYYVRVRGRNACGTSGASNEILVRVPGAGGTTAPQPTPWTTPPGPEPPGPPPPVTALIPVVQVSVPVVEPPRVVAGPPPRPDAAAGPAVNVALLASPTPSARRVRLTASRPVDTIVLAGDTRVSAQSATNGTMAAAESFYLIRLASPQTVVDLELTVLQSFTGQVSASLGNGPFGEYRAVPLTASIGRGSMIWQGLVANGDGLSVVDPECGGGGTIRLDIVAFFVQTGNNVSGLATVTGQSAPSCPEAVGSVDALSFVGTVTESLDGAGRMTGTLTEVSEGETGTMTATFANGRMTGTIAFSDGATGTFAMTRLQ